MKKTFGILVLLIVSVFLFCSCTTDNTDNNKAEFINLDGEFIPLKAAVVNSTFQEPDENKDIKTLSGSGCLYGDKISEISINVLSGVEVEVCIDDKSTKLYVESLYGADIVDLDKKDEFFELALYSMGASLDPTVDFIRYDGNEIIPLKWHDGEYSSSGICGYYNPTDENVLPPFSTFWLNQEGKIVTAFGSAQFTKDMIAFKYYELNNNEWEETLLEKLDKLPFKTKLATDVNVFFTPESKKPVTLCDTKYLLNYDRSNMTTFKKGQNIKIIDYDIAFGYYIFYAKINGKKGVLAFWTGD